MAYDSNNIFAKILRGEIPCQKVYEDAFALAFNDIQPKAPTHVLVIPKGAYATHEDFVTHASDAELVGFGRALSKVIETTGLAKSGYRMISNSGANSGQEVPHYHIHLLGGKFLGPLIWDK